MCPASAREGDRLYGRCPVAAALAARRCRSDMLDRHGQGSCTMPGATGWTCLAHPDCGSSRGMAALGHQSSGCRAGAGQQQSVAGEA